MIKNGSLIGEKAVANTPGVYDTTDAYNGKLDDSWPYTINVTSITVSSTSVDEGGQVTVSVEAEGLSNGAILYWVVNTVSGNVSSSDFSATDGIFTVSGDQSFSSGSFQISVLPDFTPDGTDVFNVLIRTESVAGPTIGTSPSITINDTSTEEPAGEDLYNSFYSIGEYRNVSGQNNTTDPFSVSEVRQGYTGSGRLYLIHKVTGATTYYNDAPIACIQVLDSSGAYVLTQWWFGTTLSPGWQTHTGAYNFGDRGAGVNITPYQAAINYTYAAVMMGSTTDKFNLATSTGSSRTGAMDGIAEPSGPMPVGRETVPQSSGKYYMYRETSGSSYPYCSLCRSPLRDWFAGEIIRIAYIIGNYNAGATYYDATDTFFLGIR